MRNVVRPPWADVLLAVVLSGLTLATLVEQSTGAHSVAAALLAVLAVAPLAWRAVMPLWAAAIILLSLAAYSVLGYGDFPNSGIGMFVAMFTVATLRSRRVAAVVFAGCAVVTTLAYALASTPLVWSQAVQAVLTVGGAWVLGEGTRRWSERSDGLAAEAATAVAQERVRIARELHDIVAHHMSVISLQAGVAEYVLDDDPATAKTAIASVSQAGRDALGDMSRLLDVLRVEHGDEDRYAPQPGLAQLDALVDRAEAAGLTVETSVSGSPRPLPPGQDLCAYRVAQESLTNVLRHAGAHLVRIEVAYDAGGLRLTVTDDGSGPRVARTSRESHGIRGMRERAQLYGGQLRAGPASSGGFEVKLRLPIGEPT